MAGQEAKRRLLSRIRPMEKICYYLQPEVDINRDFIPTFLVFDPGRSSGLAFLPEWLCNLTTLEGEAGSPICELCTTAKRR